MIKSKLLFKVLIVLAFLTAVFLYVYYDLGTHLSFQSLKANQTRLQEQFLSAPVLTACVFGLLYVLVTALSIPGAAVLTLAAGAIFGIFYGTIVVSFASTLGATLAFLGSRFLFKDFFEQKFSERFATINQGIQKDGAVYLFTLRLIPAVPFFLVNILMGLTKIPTLTFFIVSQVGMLAGTVVYINAGTQLSQLESPQDIISWKIILSFLALGFFPLFAKSLLAFFKARKHLARFKKPKKFDYNMVVIGAGSAGLVSAYIASAVKAKVALVEKHKMGGDCLNTGCVPSKALIRSAKIFSYMKRGEEFGIASSGKPEVQFSKVMARVQAIIKNIEPHDSVERYTKLGVDCINGDAKVISPYEVRVNDRVLITKNIVIATGARPLVPKLKGLESVSYLTSDNVWSLQELPKKLVVLGGGPIGCELAQAFARFGSQVSIVEMSDRLLAKEDVDVSELIYERFAQEGVQVYKSHKAVEILQKNAKNYLICEHNGRTVEIEFDQILLALGRKANVAGFGLEELHVEIAKNGTLAANEFLQTTNYPNIYTCGDVTGPYQFTHTASHQAWYVAVNALFSPFKKYKVDYRVIPWCTFTDPEVARVGLNEIEAAEKNIPYAVTKYNIDDLDRAITDGEAHGFVKVLTKPNSDHILGVTIVGSHAGDIVAEYVAAMKHGFGLNKILGTIHIYPTLAEANKFAAGVWKRANTPQYAFRWLKRFHDWRRG
jgi:dihydrolipoamide dehydrogenase